MPWIILGFCAVVVWALYLTLKVKGIALGLTQFDFYVAKYMEKTDGALTAIDHQLTELKSTTQIQQTDLDGLQSQINEIVQDLEEKQDKVEE